MGVWPSNAAVELAEAATLFFCIQSLRLGGLAWTRLVRASAVRRILSERGKAAISARQHEKRPLERALTTLRQVVLQRQKGASPLP
jgi:hypothetical protein